MTKPTPSIKIPIPSIKIPNPPTKTSIPTTTVYLQPPPPPQNPNVLSRTLPAQDNSYIPPIPSQTWPPAPALVQSSDPIALTTWGPYTYTPTSHSSRSSSSSSSKSHKKKKGKFTETKNGYARPPSSATPQAKPTEITLSGSEEAHTTETIEQVPESEGGGVRRTWIRTSRITTVEWEGIGKDGGETADKREKETNEDLYHFAEIRLPLGMETVKASQLRR